MSILCVMMDMDTSRDKMLSDALDQLEGLEVLTTSSLDHVLERLSEKEKQMEVDVCKWMLQVLMEAPDVQKLEVLEEALCVMGENAEDLNDSIQELKAHLSSYKTNMEEIAEVERDLASKQFQSQMEEQLSTFHQLKEEGQFSEAAWCLIGMQRMLADQDDTHSEHHTFTDRVKGLDAALKQMLADFYSSCFTVDVEKQQLEVKCGSPDSMAELKEMWKASEVLGQTQPTLDAISERVGAVLEAALLDSDFGVMNLISKTEVEQDVAHFGWQYDKSESVTEAAISRLKTVGALMQFLGSFLFAGLHSLAEETGNALWPGLQDLLSSRILGVAELLGENEKLSFLESTFQAATSLEEELKSSSFLTEGNVHFSYRISTTSREAFHTFSEKYVMEARDAMKSPNWDALPVGKEVVLDEKWIQQQMSVSSSEVCASDPLAGVDLLRSSLGRGAYQITETVSRIQQIIESAAAEGCSKGTLVLQSLVQGIRNICSMYSRLFPILFRKEMEVPQLGLLSANDFFYLSNEMLLLPFVVPNFKTMAPEAHFHDESRELKIVGHQLMTRQVEVQTRALQETLSQVGDFGHIRTGQQGIAMRRVVHQLTRMLSQLGRVLHEVLSTSDRCRVAVSITEAVAQPIVTKLMSRTDISVQENQELPRVIQSLLDEIPAAILNMPQSTLDALESASENRATGIDGSREAFMKAWLLYRRYKQDCPVFRKLQRLLRLWDAKLVQIVSWWTHGVLRKDGFVADDIRNLIWALFEHSDKREDAIAAITRSA